MTYKTLTRQAVDQAEPLAFDKPAAPVALATLTYHGIPVQIDLFTLDEATLSGIEKRISRLLTREGWNAPAAAPATPAAKPKRPAVTPAYDDDGTPLCPKHMKPLKDGKYGPYCSCKDETGKNGYCDLKFV